MIGEYSIMDWVQLGGILAALATVWSLFRDNQNLREKIGSILKQNGPIENAHEKLLNQQSSREKELMTVVQKVSSIDDLIKAENQKNRMIQANDQTAYEAVTNLQKYLSNTKDQKEAQMMKVVELKRTIEKLEEEKEDLQTELSQVKSRNLELSHENAKLKDGNNPKRGRGPVLRP